MKAIITDTEGFRIGDDPLVIFDSQVRFQIDCTVPQNTADEPFLVIFDDHSWGIHPATEAYEMVEDPAHDRDVHQAIPISALIREFIAYESDKPVINITGYATPVPE